jgi:hypothetical protein
MERLRTHAGPRTVDDIVRELTGRPKPPEESSTVSLGPEDFKRRHKLVGSETSHEDFCREYEAMFSAATGPVGPTGPYPSTPGANGPAGPINAPVPTGPASSPHLPLDRDRAEVDLRQALRRCFKDGVPLDRIVEIFRLELVDVVHDD